MQMIYVVCGVLNKSIELDYVNFNTNSFFFSVETITQNISDKLPSKNERMNVLQTRSNKPWIQYKNFRCDHQKWTYWTQTVK